MPLELENLYYFFLILKSDCIITKLWSVLTKFWRYTTYSIGP